MSIDKVNNYCYQKRKVLNQLSKNMTDDKMSKTEKPEEATMNHTS